MTSNWPPNALFRFEAEAFGAAKACLVRFFYFSEKKEKKLNNWSLQSGIKLWKAWTKKAKKDKACKTLIELCNNFRKTMRLPISFTNCSQYSNAYCSVN